jgi:hypothetical protein
MSYHYSIESYVANNATFDHSINEGKFHKFSLWNDGFLVGKVMIIQRKAHCVMF